MAADYGGRKLAAWADFLLLSDHPQSTAWPTPPASC
jgi:hypothetical protein